MVMVMKTLDLHSSFLFQEGTISAIYINSNRPKSSCIDTMLHDLEFWQGTWRWLRGIFNTRQTVKIRCRDTILHHLVFNRTEVLRNYICSGY
jgi:hypothetical protein